MKKKKLTDEMRKASKIAAKKADELRGLHKNIPQFITKLTVFGKGLNYVADETDRIEDETGKSVDFHSEDGFTPKAFTDNFKIINNSSGSLSDMTSTLSTMITSYTGSIVNFVTLQSVESRDYVQDLPIIFEDLKIDDELIPLLKEIKPSLAEDWQEVRDNLVLKTSQGIKNAIVHARTVVDNLGWMTDYNHIGSLSWGKHFDDKKKPIRAVRYAWINYGDDLPTKLNGDPRNDTLFKSLNSGYKEFGEITHVSPIPLSQHPNAITACNAVGIALVQYIESGMDRLKEVNNAGNQ